MATYAEDDEAAGVASDEAEAPDLITHVAVQYTHERVAQRQRRLDQQEPAFIDHYRWRADIEATMSRLKHQMGLARLRIRGMAAVRYTLFLRALGLNVFRVAACLRC